MGIEELSGMQDKKLSHRLSGRVVGLGIDGCREMRRKRLHLTHQLRVLLQENRGGAYRECKVKLDHQ